MLVNTFLSSEVDKLVSCLHIFLPSEVDKLMSYSHIFTFRSVHGSVIFTFRRGQTTERFTHIFIFRSGQASFTFTNFFNLQKRTNQWHVDKLLSSLYSFTFRKGQASLMLIFLPSEVYNLVSWSHIFCLQKRTCLCYFYLQKWTNKCHIHIFLPQKCTCQCHFYLQKKTSYNYVHISFIFRSGQVSSTFTYFFLTFRSEQASIIFTYFYLQKCWKITQRCLERFNQWSKCLSSNFHLMNLWPLACFTHHLLEVKNLQ